MKKISELQELLYGAEPQLQREMLTLWLEEVMEEIKYTIETYNYAHGVMGLRIEVLNKIDNIEKQLRDDNSTEISADERE